MSAAETLPPLREDLRLHEAAPDHDGAPAWLIQDPVRNRFFRIGWLEFECLLRWPGSPQQIAAEVEAETPLVTDPEQVLAFAAFLERHQLVRPSGEGVRRLAREAAGPGWRHWRWWLHHYLFFRIPLLRPDRWLRTALPLLRPLGSATGLCLVGGAGLLGVLLVARQWDVFQHGVLEIMSPAGITGFVIAIVLAKTAHELGHALVATHYGVRVSHMGVAFVVLWPMLYTDTSESWKLRSSRQRLAVSAAGIAVELCLAGLATLAWALLDDGPLRQAMLYLATTSWVLTLALNASPFMRFDGYFIVADLLDFPNLHERAGAAARAWLRRGLLGWDEPDPELLPASKRRLLVAFALTTWIYRLLVFLGIAVAVYLFFFKALGIFLFAVEISWFVLRPALAELSVWRQRWPETGRKNRRRLWTAALLAAIIAAVPWPYPVHAPGVALPLRQQLVFSPFAARVQTLQPAGEVAAGTTLAVFESPDLQARDLRTTASIDALAMRLRGLEALDSGLEQRIATGERVGEQLAEARATLDEVGRLQLVAEFDGIWRDLDPTLRPGAWIGNRQPVGALIDPRQWVVDAYVDERQIERLHVGARARFYPERRWRGIDAEVIEIDPTRSSQLPHPILDSRYGGPIPAHAGDRHGIPTEALYRIRLALASPLAEAHETRGRTRIDASASSLAWDAAKATIAVLIRESGF